MMLRVWSQVYGLPGVSLRYFNVYGPGQSEKGEYALVIGKFYDKKEKDCHFLLQVMVNKHVILQVFMMVRANILAAETKAATGGEVINIGAGDNRTINSVAK